MNWHLAAEHYEKAWGLKPDAGSACWISAGSGRLWDGPRTRRRRYWPLARGRNRAPPKRPASCCRSAIPTFTSFRRALELDPSNVDLRRELAYLYLEMGDRRDAERSSRRGLAVPGDLLSAAQLGFLLLSRGDSEGAKALLERVLEGRPNSASRPRGV